MKKVKSTTVCAVLKDGKIAIGADGQATMGNTVAKYLTIEIFQKKNYFHYLIAKYFL